MKELPFDGISSSETGYKIPLPAENNIQAEMAAKAQASVQIKKLEESHKVLADGKNKRDRGRQNSKKQKEDEEFDEDLPEFVNKSKTKKYKVSFNQSLELVELIDRETGDIIETISPNDLLSLVSKSKAASGILVDRKI